MLPNTFIVADEVIGICVAVRDKVEKMVSIRTTVGNEVIKLQSGEDGQHSYYCWQ
jgi:hypothetical protein